jgi:DNA (cytosine-5)-methyltransferase 1
MTNSRALRRRILARPRLLDLFCGAGGCSVGYQRAGFDVIGVDIEPMPRYPYTLVRDDAVAVLDCLVHGERIHGMRLEDFDAIHASPPCPAYSLASHYHGTQANHPDLYQPVKALLERSRLPYVIENVEGSPLRRDVVLCGEMFGLRVHRHRVFETAGFFVMRPRHAPHQMKGALHNCHIEEGHARQVAGNYANHEDALDAMGVDWPMSRRELRNAIPPAYTEHIGGYLMAVMNMEKAA